MPVRILAVFGVFFQLVVVGKAHAQVLTGRVLEEGTGSPIHAAFVKVVDGSERTVTAVLTDARGRFRARVGEGVTPVRLEIAALGHETYTQNVEPALGASIGDVHLPVKPVVLSGITARADNLCRHEEERGRETQLVWDEARKALEVASWALEEGLFRYELSVSERELDASGTVRESDVREWASLARRPFSTLKPEDLQADGYVREGPNGLTAHAPDADVLLSNEFLSAHCLVLIREAEQAHLGLAFSPNRRTAKSDIAGTLWMREDPLEPDYLEYRYVNVPGFETTDRFGGEVDFRRLPTGAWVVDSWRIRTPIRAQVVERTLAGPIEVVRTVGLLEAGGDIRAIVNARGQQVARPDGAAVTGTVHDEIRGGPLGGAVVRVVGTDYAARTDEAGAFRISGLPSGRYEVRVDHPWLSRLGFLGPRRTVTLASRDSVGLALQVDSIVRLTSSDPRRIAGQLVDGRTGEPVTETAVLVSIGPEGPLHDRARVSVTDSLGRFSFDLSDETGPLSLRALALGWENGPDRDIGLPAGMQYQRSIRLSPVRRPGLASPETSCSSLSSPDELSAVWEEITDVLRLVLVVPQLARHRFDFQEGEVASGRFRAVSRTTVHKEFYWETGIPLPVDRAAKSLTDGFREVTEEGTVYHPLDIRMFLTPEFKERYCLVAERAAENGGPVHVGFRPRGTERDEGRVDLVGDFILDASWRPRRIVYGYVGGGIESQPMAEARGALALSALDDRGWMIAKWSRMLPLVGTSTAVADRDETVGEWLPVRGDLRVGTGWNTDRFTQRLLSNRRSVEAESPDEVAGPGGPMFHLLGGVDQVRLDSGPSWEWKEGSTLADRLVRFSPLEMEDGQVAVRSGWLSNPDNCLPDLYLEGRPVQGVDWIDEWLPEQDGIQLLLERDPATPHCAVLAIESAPRAR